MQTSAFDSFNHTTAPLAEYLSQPIAAVPAIQAQAKEQALVAQNRALTSQIQTVTALYQEAVDDRQEAIEDRQDALELLALSHQANATMTATMDSTVKVAHEELLSQLRASQEI
jgi:hypothetical protein